MAMFFGVSVQAQETTEDLTSKYGVQYPISELGGCNSFSECRTFCQDPVNSVACVQFAKQKGFYQEDPVVTKKDQIIEIAKRELSCANESECKAFCQIPANYEKCETFARKNNLIGGRVAPIQSSQILEKAKQVLGCDSAQSCASYCSNPDNQSKCSEFAKQSGLRGGEVKRGPGNCTSDETCKAYCSDPVNFTECSRFSGETSGFRGPGGCNSQESCQSYCQTNPNSCKVISVDPYGGPGIIDNPQKAAEEFRKYCEGNSQRCGNNQSTNFFADKEARVEFEKFCSANPEACGAKSYLKQTDTDRRAEYERYCKEKPADCGVGPGGYLIPGYKGIASQGGYVNPAEYCKKSPDRCPNEKRYDYRYERVNFDPSQMCNKTPNCRWENGSCYCGDYKPGASQGNTACQAAQPSSGCGLNSYWDFGTCSCRATYNSSSYTSGNQMSREDQERMCRSGGGSCDWSSGICNCQGYKSPYGGSTTGNYPTPGAYSGTSGYTSNPEEACKRGGGSWNGTSCQMPASGSGSYNQGIAEQSCKGAGGTWMGSYCQMPNQQAPVYYSGNMSRESQESGCRACGGTCNWNGDFCNCRCGSTSNSGSTSQPAPTQPPSTQSSGSTQPSSDPATACGQTTGCSWNGSSCQCGSTQGVSSVRTLWDQLTDFLQLMPL